MSTTTIQSPPARQAKADRLKAFALAMEGMSETRLNLICERFVKQVTQDGAVQFVNDIIDGKLPGMLADHVEEERRNCGSAL